MLKKNVQRLRVSFSRPLHIKVLNTYTVSNSEIWKTVLFFRAYQIPRETTVFRHDSCVIESKALMSKETFWCVLETVVCCLGWTIVPHLLLGHFVC